MLGAGLAWWIAAGFRLGFEIDSVTLVNFFSELVDHEMAMSDSRFASLWNRGREASGFTTERWLD